MTKTFEPVLARQPTIEDLRYGYAKNSRNITPELKFHYSHLKYIPLIQFVNTGKTFDTVFNKFEYQMREILGFKWDNNIRRIYYYDGGKIAIPFHCYFADPHQQDFFEITLWNLDGSRTILNKKIKFKTNYPDQNTSYFSEWYNFILPEEVVNEIGLSIRNYIDNLVKFI